MGKIKKYFLSSFPVVIIICIWIFFSSPYFFAGKVPYPSTYQVNNFAPWSAQEKFWGPVKNGAMPDVITQIYPWKYLTIQTYKSGQMPLWNPYNFSGNPHLANFQTAVFSPFNILFFILPFVDAWSIGILIQPLIAGVCMYFFLRSLPISKEGSVLGGVSYMFCGFIVVWMAYGTLSMTIAFLPLTLFAINKIYEKQRMMSFFLLIASVVFSLFSGHFQTSIYLLLFSFAFFIFKSITAKKKKETFLVFLGFISGILIAFPQLLPSIQLYLNSVRSITFIKGGGIPFYYLVTIFSPDFFGNPVTRNDWLGYYAEFSSFVGIIPFMLGFISLSRIKNKSIYFFLFSTVISLLLAVDSPIQMLIGNSMLPVISTSNPTRIIVLFSFSICVLAAFGIDALRELIVDKGKKVRIPIGLVTILLLTIWISLLVFHVLPPDKATIAKRNLLLPSALFVISSLLILIAKYFKNKKVILLIFYFIISLAAFDSLRFAQKWMPFDPRSLVFPDVNVIAGIKKNIGFGRIYGNLGTEVNTYYGLASIEGYDPLYIGRYGEFIQSANQGKFIAAQRSVARLDRRGKYTDRVLDLLGVNLIFHPRPDTYQGWAYPVWEKNNKYSIVYEDDKFQLFRNNSSLPRATLFYEYQVLNDDKKIIETFYNDAFDFRRILLLEEEPDGEVGKGKNTGNAEIIVYQPDKIVIFAKTTDPALLFLGDTYYPGWSAKINGDKVKTYRGNYAFRAILLPKGESTVEFNYNPFLTWE